MSSPARIGVSLAWSEETPARVLETQAVGFARARRAASGSFGLHGSRTGARCAAVLQRSRPSFCVRCWRKPDPARYERSPEHVFRGREASCFGRVTQSLPVGCRSGVSTPLIDFWVLSAQSPLASATSPLAMEAYHSRRQSLVCARPFGVVTLCRGSIPSAAARPCAWPAIKPRAAGRELARARVAETGVVEDRITDRDRLRVLSGSGSPDKWRVTTGFPDQADNFPDRPIQFPASAK